MEVLVVGGILFIVGRSCKGLQHLLGDGRATVQKYLEK